MKQVLVALFLILGTQVLFAQEQGLYLKWKYLPLPSNLDEPITYGVGLEKQLGLYSGIELLATVNKYHGKRTRSTAITLEKRFGFSMEEGGLNSFFFSLSAGYAKLERFVDDPRYSDVVARGLISGIGFGARVFYGKTFGLETNLSYRPFIELSNSSKEFRHSRHGDLPFVIGFNFFFYLPKKPR